jgi:hypothetical protein
MQRGMIRGRVGVPFPPPICKKIANAIPLPPQNSGDVVSVTARIKTTQGPVYVWTIAGTIYDTRIFPGQPINLWFIGSITPGPLTINNNVHFSFDLTSVQFKGPVAVKWQPKFGAFSALAVQLPQSP